MPTNDTSMAGSEAQPTDAQIWKTIHDAGLGWAAWRGGESQESFVGDAVRRLFTPTEALSAATVAQPVGAVAMSRAALIDLVEERLHAVYHCTRVWSAWQVGTMTEDDFTEARGTALAPDIADAVLALSATIVHPVGWQVRGIGREDGPGMWRHADEEDLQAYRNGPDMWELRPVFAQPCASQGCGEAVRHALKQIIEADDAQALTQQLIEIGRAALSTDKSGGGE